MPSRTNIVGVFLFFSGMCALIFQVVWLREMRLVFGASTGASAAVLAIFMGGLGAGGALFGRRADRSSNALQLYAHLELIIAGSAALTPVLLAVARAAYIGLGGSPVLGPSAATLVRLGLAALVLGVPATVMGGTLPAAARAVMSSHDIGRRALARLYGMNTVGAVVGATAATFSLMETVGARTTLLVACLLNALVGVSARALARTPVSHGSDDHEHIPENGVATGVPAPSFILLVAGVSGFVFFLMELVWYRMLGPVLGGSTYTFGLVLALALAGIGIGGFLYALRDPRRAPSLREVASTCALEALFIAVPLALGDRLAVLAALLTPLGNVGLHGSVLGWTLVAAMTMFPAAVVAGYQFPLLIGLLGRGDRHVGRHAGLAYACNTLGAIVGSLAGGFLLLPALTAPGAWRLAVACLVVLCVAALALIGRSERLVGRGGPLALGLCALACLLPAGPTAVWRHSAIGAGRVDLTRSDRLKIRDWSAAQRRSLIWEREGRESSIGVIRTSGLSLVVNGKSDGNAITDASTQIMLGLVGATMHAAPRTALVIGLGTGETAGWLADVPGMERVDVVEFEPAVVEVARLCGPANRGAMDNPRVRIVIADGREVVLASKDRYDLIASEPSNPFRAGIASLYTREFYRAVAQRLAPGGIFTQWVQAYEVDTETILSIYATLLTAFPVVETWQTNPTDMLMVCSMDSLNTGAAHMAQRLALEPIRTGALMAWGVVDLPGFLSRRVAGAELAEQAARVGRAFGVTTDDRTVVEYGFARAVGRTRTFRLSDLREVAGQGSDDGLTAAEGEAVRAGRHMMYALQGVPIPPGEINGAEEQARSRAYLHFMAGDYAACLAAWNAQRAAPRYPLELAMIAEAAADRGDTASLALSSILAPLWPTESAIIESRLWARTGMMEEAVEAVEEACRRMRHDPWPCSRVMERGLQLAAEIAVAHPDLAPRCRAALADPFSVDALHDQRLRALLDVSLVMGPATAAEVVHQYEPHVPWTREFLALRARCYRETNDALAGKALADWERFIADAPLAVTPDLLAIEPTQPPSPPASLTESSD